MTSFFGIELTSDKVSILDCEPGAQLLVSNACLLNLPKNINSRVFVNVFSPDDEHNLKTLVVFSANGIQTLMLKNFFTSKIGFRLSGKNIDGAVVHIVGSKSEPGFQFGALDDASDASDEAIEDNDVMDEGNVGESRKSDNSDAMQATSKRIKTTNNVTEKEIVIGEKKKKKIADDNSKDEAPTKSKKRKGVSEKEANGKNESDAKSSEDDEAEIKARKELAQSVRKSEDPPRRKDTKTLKSGLKIRDVLIGTGKPVKKGRNVAVKYTLSLTNGNVVDKSGKHAFKFRLGIGECIKGFDIGVDGMREGGERVVEVPSALAYGKRGAPPDIKPNTDLIFDVKVVKAW